MELAGYPAGLIARISGTGVGAPTAAVTTQLFDTLRPFLLRAEGASPRFVICTIDLVHCNSARARLSGTCAPLLPTVTDSISPPV